MRGKDLTIAIAKLDGYSVRQGWSNRHNCACWTLYGKFGRIGLPNIHTQPWYKAPHFATSIDALDDLCFRKGFTWTKDSSSVLVMAGRRKFRWMVNDGEHFVHFFALAVLDALRATS